MINNNNQIIVNLIIKAIKFIPNTINNIIAKATIYFLVVYNYRKAIMNILQLLMKSNICNN